RGGAAEALFLRGRTEMKDGRFPAACESFSRSFQLDPAPGTALNLSLCEEKLGKVASAWIHLRDYLDRSQQDDDRRPAALEYLTRLESEVPHLTVNVD